MRHRIPDPTLIRFSSKCCGALGALLFLAVMSALCGCGDSAGSGTLVQVDRVIDGDTIVLQGGERVRYIGMDTPELRGSSAIEKQWAELARIENEELLEDADVRIVLGVAERDRYGRLLAYVYADGVFVNLRLVELGYARQMTIPPNVKYAELFAEAERKARMSGQGLWAGGGGGQ